MRASDDSRIVRRVSGYVPGTGLLWESHDLPPALLEYAKCLVQVDPDDPEALASYPLGPVQAKKLARFTRWPLQTDRCHYFLETFVEPDLLVSMRQSLAAAAPLTPYNSDCTQ